MHTLYNEWHDPLIMSSIYYLNKVGSSNVIVIFFFMMIVKWRMAPAWAKPETVNHPFMPKIMRSICLDCHTARTNRALVAWSMSPSDTHLATRPFLTISSVAFLKLLSCNMTHLINLWLQITFHYCYWAFNTIFVFNTIPSHLDLSYS